MTRGALATTNRDLVSHFECPVCYDFALPPIPTCLAGHLICSNCRPKLTCCPTCRGPFGASLRSFDLEKIAATVLFPCRYSTSGCKESLFHTVKIEHEVRCEFRAYTCPYPAANCKFQGPLKQVIPHLTEVHEEVFKHQDENVMFSINGINANGSDIWVRLQNCFGHNFMFVLKKQEIGGCQHFFATVHLIGTPKQAERFAYRLELSKHSRRLLWQASTRSIREPISAAILKSDCLHFDAATAQFFARDGNLWISSIISRFVSWGRD